jgi:hypothetical protein
MSQPKFCGHEPGPRTHFVIETTRAYSIVAFSSFGEEEAEVLFRPLAELCITAAVCNIIDAKESRDISKSGHPDMVMLTQLDEVDKGADKVASEKAAAKKAAAEKAAAKKAAAAKAVTASTTQAVQIPQHQHILKFHRRDRGYSCDVCRCSFSAGDHSYCCCNCNFDACIACASKYTFKAHGVAKKQDQMRPQPVRKSSAKRSVARRPVTRTEPGGNGLDNGQAMVAGAAGAAGVAVACALCTIM